MRCTVAAAFQGGDLRYEMSTDKIGELDQAIAEIFSGPHLISIKALPDFDHGALAEIFNEPLPIFTGTEPPPPRFDHHQALAEIFGEPSPVPIDPPSLSIDEESSSPLFRRPSDGEPVGSVVAVAAPSTNAESARPQRAESLLAKLRYIFATKAEPLHPSPEEDSSASSPSGQLHTKPAVEAIVVASTADAERTPTQGAKEPLTESSLSVERETLSPRLFDQPGYVGQAVNDVAATSRNHTSERSPRATPSLIETASPVSTKMEPTPSVLAKQPSFPTAAGGLDNVYPAATAVVTARADEESGQQAGLLLTEPSPLDFLYTAPQPPLSETPLRQVMFDRLDNLESAADTAPIDAESVGARQLTSAPIDAPPMTPIDENFSLVRENGTSRREIRSGQWDHAESAEIIVAVPPADAESARPQRATSLPAKLPLNISADAKSPPLIFEDDLSRPTISSPLDHPEPAANPISVAPPADTEDASIRPREATPLLSDVPPPPLIPENEPSPLSSQPNHVASIAEIVAAILSGDAASAGREQREPLPTPLQLSRGHRSTTLSGELVNIAPAAKPAPAAPRIHVGAMQPHQTTALPLTAPPSLVSSNTNSFPILEEEQPPLSLGVQLDHAEPATKATAVPPPTDRQGTLPWQAKPLQAEEHLAVSKTLNGPVSLKETPQRPAFYGRRDDLEADVRAAAVSPAPSTHGAVTPLQAKSLLAELDLDSAIRLRWVMRDIRSNRMGMSPASENDLAALVELGLVEMREKLPSLTALGVRELN
jgi:hypothetical protein